jgi:hypothetical protein
MMRFSCSSVHSRGSAQLARRPRRDGNYLGDVIAILLEQLPAIGAGNGVGHDHRRFAPSMMTKYGVCPAGVIWPADVTLTSNWQPLAKSSSATRTANGAPTATCMPKPPHDIAIGVQDADCRNIDGREALLPPRFAQQRRGPENRRRGGVFVVGQRHGSGHRAFKHRAVVIRPVLRQPVQV